MLLFLSQNLQFSIFSNYLGENVGKAYNLSDLFFDFDEASTSFKSKMCIRFSSLLLWIMLLRIFYWCILSKLHLCEHELMETAFKTQLQYISLAIQA